MKKLFIIIQILTCLNFTSHSQNTPANQFKKANEYFRQKQYGNAIKLYDSIIKDDKYALLAYMNKGQALEFQRKFQDAIANYTTLLNLVPQLNPPLMRRGISYIKLQMYQEGIADLKKA